MARAANGEPDKAEALLRQALAQRGDDAKIKQNLAIVLGLQGRHEDAQQIGTQVAAMTGDEESVRANADVLRRLVKAEPRPAAAPQQVPAAAQAPAKAAPQMQSAARQMTDAEADALVAKAIAAAAKHESGTAVAGWKKEAGKAANR